ncbi:MAG: glycosyltransferase, partial [Campylobacterota bacterium]
MSNTFNKTISVIIATYNGAAYIRAQLESIAAQTLQPTEIIVQDDCSSDDTVEIVRSYRSS